MFRFEHPQFLYLLLLLPGILLLFLWVVRNKKKVIRIFGDEALVAQLMSEYSPGNYFLKFLFISLSFSFLIFAIANPQLGNKIEKVKRQGVDVMIALDVSKSMLSEDIKPSRLLRSKQAVSDLIDKLETDRIGLILFAGRAYLQMPLTTDHSAAKLFLDNISPDMVPTQGTAIGAAIDLADESFQDKEKKYKSLIIVTDGENHEDDAVEAATAVADKGTIINVIGVGSPEGGPIPIYTSGVITGYKKDEKGSIVLSKINEAAMEEIAHTGKGHYYHLGNSQDEIKALVKNIEQMEHRNFEDQEYTDYEDYFQYCLLIAFIFLTLEFIISEKRFSQIKWLRQISLAIAVIIFANLNLFAQVQGASQKTPTNTFRKIKDFVITPPSTKMVREGNKLYQDKKFAEAKTQYEQSITKRPDQYQAPFNLGDALYQQNQYEKAREAYQYSLNQTQEKNLQSKTYHNIGNTYLEERKYPEAIAAYKEALKRNPVDKDTQYNLSYALKMMQQQKSQNKKNKNDKGDQNKKDNQKQDQEKKDQQNKKDEQQKRNSKEDNEKKKEEQKQAGKLSKEEADRRLEALKNEEKKTQDKVRKQKVLVGVSKTDKDW